VCPNFATLPSLAAGIIGLEASYILPIFLRLTVARKWFKKGPFHLGRFSIIIGSIGVVWGCFISVREQGKLAGGAATGALWAAGAAAGAGWPA